MNLPVIFSKILPAMKSAAGTGTLMAKKHAPELLILAGITGFGVTIFETVKATNKTNEIVEDRETTLRTIDDMRTECTESEYSEASYVRDIKNANGHAKWAIIRAWLPVATLGTTSVIFVLSGYRILNGRYVATAAAYKVLEGSFDRYRGNVIERFGKDTDWEMLHSIKAEELAKAREEQQQNREIDADNKHKKIGKKRKKTAYANIYNCIFDEYSDHWQRYWTPDQVMYYLRAKEKEMNELVMLRGFAFVNEAYDKLGVEWTAEGQVTGWLRPKHLGTKPMQKIVDFGLDDMPEEELRRILSTRRNDEIRVPIQMNPHGLIYNMIDKDYRLGIDRLDFVERQKLEYYD
jgi:hypothetical protein